MWSTTTSTTAAVIAASSTVLGERLSRFRQRQPWCRQALGAGSDVADATGAAFEGDGLTVRHVLDVADQRVEGWIVGEDEILVNRPNSSRMAAISACFTVSIPCSAPRSGRSSTVRLITRIRNHDFNHRGRPYLRR